MGVVLSLTAGVCFAAFTILIRLGMRNRAADDGLLMTVLVNTVILGVVALFMNWPPFDLAGVAALLAGGVVGTVFGRAANLRAVRRIGPTRTNAFLTVNPIVSAIGGWLVLDEAVSLGEAIGGVLVITGLFRLIRRGAVVSAGQGQTMTAPALAAQTAERRTAAGYVYAAAAPVFFGFAFVARKWGLQFFPNAVIGAFIGSAAAFIVVVAGDAFGGRLRERMHHNFREVPWLFVWAGIASERGAPSPVLCLFLRTRLGGRVVAGDPTTVDAGAGLSLPTAGRTHRFQTGYLDPAGHRGNRGHQPPDLTPGHHRQKHLNPDRAPVYDGWRKRAAFNSNVLLAPSECRKAAASRTSFSMPNSRI